MIDPDNNGEPATSTEASFSGLRPAASIENLRKMVNNDEYIDAAIQRIALVLSDEILNYKVYTKGGQCNERFRKRRK